MIISTNRDGRRRETAAEASEPHSNVSINSPENTLCNRTGISDSPAASFVNITYNDDELFSQEAVLITDYDEDSYNTAATLLYCRRRILKPRDIVFSILGYRSWNKDGADSSMCIKVFNVIYFILLFLCLCIGPVLQYDICFKRDQGVGSESWFHHGNFTAGSGEGDIHLCSRSLIFVYIIPSLLFFFGFMVTCIILRLGESEHLQTLLERVYLTTSSSPWEYVKHHRLWCIFLGWTMVGIFCLILSLTSMILHIQAASHIIYSFIKPHSESEKMGLVSGALASLWLQDIVVVVGILLYCTQCHLLSRLLHIIITSLNQSTTSLLIIKKQIDESSRFLRHLNQELGLSVGLYLCLIAFRAITATCSLFSEIKQYELPKMLAILNESNSNEDLRDGQDPNKMFTSKDNGKMWFHISAMLTNVIPWVLLTIMPLCMAARVSSSYRALSKAGSQLHGRPFGYQSTPQTDIDSFLLYVSSLHLQAKILWIPVRTYFLVAVFVLSIMSVIILSYLYL